MLRVARSCIAAVVGIAVAAPTSAMGAPRSSAPVEAPAGPAAAAPGDSSVVREEVRVLVKRADLRRAVGDDAGAITLLTDALEHGIDARLEPRVEAEIRLKLLEIHETSGHHEIADRVRAALLRERDLLELTPDEVDKLRRGTQRSQPATTAPGPQPQGPPAPTTGRGSSSVVEEKVIESEVFSDRKMIGSGIGLVTVGLGFGLGGAVLLIYARSTENSLDEYEIPEQEDERNRAISDGTAENGAGIAFIAVGGVLVLTGCTLIGVGYARKRARLGKTTTTKTKTKTKKQARVVPSPFGLEVRF